MIDKKPFQRQIVYFINDSEYDNLQYYDEGRELITNEEVMTVPVSESENFINKFEVLGNTLPSNKTMLLLSPMNKMKYAEISESEIIFPLEKLSNIIRLCQLIGAKKIKIENIYNDSNYKEIYTKTNVSAKANTIKGSVDTISKKIDELYKYIGYETTFKGGKPNYEVAKNFLRETKLNSDHFISNLVEMKNPIFLDNEIESISNKVQLTSKSEKTFKLLAALKVPIGSGKFEINTQNISENKYSLDITIDF